MHPDQLRILFAGGGSGGHIYPLFAIEAELTRKFNVCALYIAANKPIDAHILSDNNKRFLLLNQITANPFSIPNIIGIVQSLVIVIGTLLLYKPVIVISTASRTSVLPIVLSKFFGRRIFLVELNSTFGKVSRILAPLADEIFTCWPATSGGFTALKRSRLIVPPSRQVALQASPEGKDRPPRILIVGGSQGARALNMSIPPIIRDLRCSNDFHVVHVTGRSDYEAVRRLYEGLAKTEVIPYTEELPQYISRSDIIISRAGANVIFECAMYAKAVFLVPITSSSLNHQFSNARVLASKNAAVILTERQLNSGHAGRILLHYLNSLEERERMGKNLRGYFFDNRLNSISGSLKRAL